MRLGNQSNVGVPALRSMSVTNWLQLDPLRGFDSGLIRHIESALEDQTDEKFWELIQKLVWSPIKDIASTGQIFVLDGQHSGAFKVCCGLVGYLKSACAAPSRADARSLCELYNDYTKVVAGYPIRDLLKSELDLLVISNMDSFEGDRLKDKLSSIISARMNSQVITILETANADIALDEFRLLKSSFNERLVTVWPKRK